MVKLTLRYCRQRDFHSYGFTLVEMAIVVVIIGMLMGLGIKSANFVMENSAYSATKKKQETIKDALVSYLSKYGRLPCPDVRAATVAASGKIDFPASAPDGKEDLNGTQCDYPFGLVPYEDLQLNQDIALDGWGNYFDYQISTATPDKNWGFKPTVAPNNVIVDDLKLGGLQLITKDDINNNQTTTSHWVVALVSHGKNGFGAFNKKGKQNDASDAVADEKSNIYDDANPDILNPSKGSYKPLVTHSTPSSLGFDDLVAVISASDLISPLNQQKTLFARQQALTDLAQIKGSLISMIAADGMPAAHTCSKSAMPQPANNKVPALLFPATDPWGMPYNYYRGTIPTVGSGGDTAFIIWSSGPNGTNESALADNPQGSGKNETIISGGDDVGLSLSFSSMQVQAELANAGVLCP